MKAFRVKYDTEVYRVFSELVLAPNEADIPAHLAAQSNKNFIPGHPECHLRDVVEIPIEDLPIRELTVGDLFQLIDSRLPKAPPAVDVPAPPTISDDVIAAISRNAGYDELKNLLNREKLMRMEAIEASCKILPLDSPEGRQNQQEAKRKYDQSAINMHALRYRIDTLSESASVRKKDRRRKYIP